MTSKLKRAVNVTAFALALGLTAATMSAQQGQGTFQLPFAAHWGNMNLQPGDYQVKIPLGTAQKTVYLYGGESTQMTVPLVSDQTPVSNRSYLRAVSVNGTYYIDEYVIGPAGRKYLFHVPENERRLTTSQTAEAKSGSVDDIVIALR